MTGYVLIFVAGKEEYPLDTNILAPFRKLLLPHTLNWLHPNKAAEIHLTMPVELNILREAASQYGIDVFQVPSEHRRKKLLLADMDATIVEGETLDDLAGFAGLKDKIATITERAMRGELDFKEALEQRVKMLEGLSVTALQRTLFAMKLNKGAKDVVRVMRKHGAECYLVSGGFTYFTGAMANECGFNGHHGNVLEIIDDRLTGNVIPPILDKTAKLTFLREYTQKCGILRAETMAVGDGANDIPMLLEAGTGVGFEPKPLVKEQIPNAIIHTDLTSLLYIQGYNYQDLGQDTAL